MDLQYSHYRHEYHACSEYSLIPHRENTRYTNSCEFVKFSLAIHLLDRPLVLFMCDSQIDPGKLKLSADFVVN